MTLRRPALDLRGLIGSHELFRLNGGRRRHPDVEQWFLEGSGELRSIAKTWFETMRRCADDVLELIHDGGPVACIEDAPFGYVNAYAHHVNIGFFHGATLDDPAGLLQGSGKRMRHVKLKLDTKIDAAALRKLIEAAHADIRSRLAGG